MKLPNNIEYGITTFYVTIFKQVPEQSFLKHVNSASYICWYLFRLQRTSNDTETLVTLLLPFCIEKYFVLQLLLFW